MKRFAVLTMLMAVVVVLALPTIDAAKQEDPDWGSLYPDADYIIYQGERGYVNSLHHIGFDSAGKHVYKNTTIRNGNSYSVIDLSDIDGSVDIVMHDGNLGDLTLVTVDDILSDDSKVDIRFRMVSGSVDDLIGVEARGSIVDQLPSSYYMAYSPIGSLRMEVSGDVGTLAPTIQNIGVRELSLDITDTATVDRLYPSGEDGRYIDIQLRVVGADIGYMSNQSAVVTHLEYELVSGHIRYMSLGADTEGGLGYHRAEMWTFYVMRDVDIRIGEDMIVDNAILGAGLLDHPTVLCNGELPDTVFARNVSIHAPWLEMDFTSCFILDNDRTMRFANYEIDGRPSIGLIRTSYYISYQTVPIYGDGGIWSDYQDTIVLKGCVLYIETSADIPADGTLRVDSGGRLVNTSDIFVHGTIEAQGEIVNGGIIELRDTGQIQGDITGTGYIAKCIYAKPNEGSVQMMTMEGDTIVMRAIDDAIVFSYITVRFNEDSTFVEIRDVSGNGIIGTEFVVSLRQTATGWDLYTEGFKDHKGIEIDVTIPVSVPSGDRALILDPSGEEVSYEVRDPMELKFSAASDGEYTVRILDGSASDGAGFWDYLFHEVNIVIAIVIVATVIVYALLKRD